MEQNTAPRCHACQTKHCRAGVDCFDTVDSVVEKYREPRIGELHRAATAIEGRHYCREPRIRETMLFAREMGFKKLGLAFCVGLADEAEIIGNILATEFEVVSVCCKVGGISKKTLDLEQIHPEQEHETTCNPIGQAMLLNQAGTQLNILCGLCVGHDALLSMYSEAPVTTLIVKDRVLAHNPIGAIYSRYIRRTLLPE